MSDKQSQHVPQNDVLQQPYNVRRRRRHLRGQQQQQVLKQAQQVGTMSVCENTALTSTLQMLITIGVDLPTLHEIMSMIMILTHSVPGAGVPAECPPR